MKKPIIIERFADNGEHSHWDLIKSEDGCTLWSEDWSNFKVMSGGKVNVFADTIVNAMRRLPDPKKEGEKKIIFLRQNYFDYEDMSISERKLEFTAVIDRDKVKYNEPGGKISELLSWEIGI